ncbi:uncharacterized protein A1O9_08689, partial [Exophiala aquamarina CBS 119918]
ILLNTSVARFSNTTELIPWQTPCSTTRYIDQIIILTSSRASDLYTSFFSLDCQNSRSSQEFRVLVQGHKHAGQILDTLEMGVFQELQCGYLQVLQMFVTKNMHGRQTLLESYSFAFEYDHGTLSSIQLSPIDHTFVFANPRVSFKSGILAALRFHLVVDTAPTSRKFGINMAYNENRPTLYQP